MRLTKTDILSGLQCDKKIYLAKFNPDVAVPVNTPAMMTGEVVEEHARQLFPGGVPVDRFQTEFDPFKHTQHLLEDDSVHVIFQAGFIANGVEVFVDILERENNAWNIIEVKASTEIKGHFIDDLAIQFITARNAGLLIHQAKLMYINKEYDIHRNQHLSDLFYIEDVTDRVLAHIPVIEAEIKRLKSVLEQPQPDVPISGHCKRPNPCEFRAHCENTGSMYPVGQLPNGHAVIKRLHAVGILDIRDIPDDALKSETHKRVRRITKSGREELNPEVSAILNDLAYPRFYLDFETIQFAIPIWPNTQPYDQLPFQFSCHIERDDSTLEHREFLDVSGEDCRERFVNALLECCERQGPIIVYNESFEKRIISELAEYLPNRARALLALNDRVFDLLPVVKQHYYHPDMKGSWSIKKVLPCLVPELSYGDLGSVQNGTEAQQAYFELIKEDKNDEERNRLIAELKAYCKLDTLAMVEMMKKLGEPKCA